jgi:hypothetical protein
VAHDVVNTGSSPRFGVALVRLPRTDSPSLEQGEELGVVSDPRPRHITTTANVYGHLTDRLLDRAAERTDVILGRVTG